MNVRLLIDSVVRQTTVLLAQLATSGGARAPLAHVANQVFLDLASELGQQGVSRKVGADMFGLALRTYQRKLQRLSESATERGRSLWEAVYAFVFAEGTVAQSAVLRHFSRDDDLIVRGVLNELVETGLLYRTGSGRGARYRASRGDHDDLGDDAGALEMIWAIVYHEGPMSRSALARLLPDAPVDVDAALSALVADQRVQVMGTGPSAEYSASHFVVPLGSEVGWEAAVLNHFNALVRTVCRKLVVAADPQFRDTVGGSTYTFHVWPGHPYEAAVLETLTHQRQQLGKLRSSVAEHNAAAEKPHEYTEVITYVGQCTTPREGPAESGDES